jgi:hypothetical protein
MFYKSSSRSTVLDRQPALQANDHVNPQEDEILETQLIEAQQRSQKLRNPKLSNFEKELLQAWSQD